MHSKTQNSKCAFGYQSAKEQKFKRSNFGWEDGTKSFKHRAPVPNVDHKLLKPVIKLNPGSQEESRAGPALSGKGYGRDVWGKGRGSTSVLSPT